MNHETPEVSISDPRLLESSNSWVSEFVNSAVSYQWAISRLIRVR